MSSSSTLQLSDRPPEADGPLLEVDDLHVEFHTRDGVATAINGVDLHLDAGETLAVLGESGSGKSRHRPGRSWASSTCRPATIPEGRILLPRRGPADHVGRASAAAVRGPRSR